MNYTKKAFSALWLLAISLLAMPLRGHAQTASIPTVLPPAVLISTNFGSLYTNCLSSGTTTFPLLVTNTQVLSNSATGILTTNTVTNTITGIIDNSKQACLAPQIMYVGAGTNASTTNTVTATYIPSLDGVNFDTTTNTGLVQVTTVNALNLVSSTTNSSMLNTYGISAWKLTNIVISGGLVGGGDFFTISNLTLQTGPKRAYSPY